MAEWVRSARFSPDIDSYNLKLSVEHHVFINEVSLSLLTSGRGNVNLI